MDKDTCFIMKPVKGVEEVNHLLQQYDLKQISEMIGIPSAPFMKQMDSGDYF
ncbi:hypothetical protein P9D55_20645 [Bacillus sonorensis]|uniref:hypothetical protein n=1 Tax=Bacillus sonorensis TaxID=119858 RepID=UPI002DB8ACBA|nr:hypothetical protein [Bacillus sonorensis]MEC1538344.1 hypothetical protein [Bacillus sonorensis]